MAKSGFGFAGIVGAALILAISVGAAAKDVAGSADHPLIGRFEGAVINAYDFKDFDEYELLTGPVKGKKAASAKKLSGKMYRIAYKLAPGHSLAEISRNYQLKLEKSGFDILYQCQDKSCGRGDFGYRIETMPIPKMTVDNWNFRYLAAMQHGDSGLVHAAILISVDANKYARIQVFVVEAEAMKFRMVDADAMAKAISETGRVALYGIYFDTDKAVIKPESRPTLEEIAAFLKQRPGLAVVVVGHTDNQGKLDYNMQLSRRRAKAVAQSLAADFGIKNARLTAAGVGFLAPVAPNATEDGRALNRRVELIER